MKNEQREKAAAQAEERDKTKNVRGIGDMRKVQRMKKLSELRAANEEPSNKLIAPKTSGCPPRDSVSGSLPQKQASTTADVQKAPEPMIQEASDKQKDLKSQRDARDDDLTDIECDPPPKRPRLLTSQIQKGTTLDELHLERSASKRETLITHTTDAKGKSSVLPTVVSEKLSLLKTNSYLSEKHNCLFWNKEQRTIVLSEKEWYHLGSQQITKLI